MARFRGLALAVAALLLGAGCSGTPAPGQPGSDRSPSSQASGDATSDATPDPDRRAAPTTAPEGTQFGFDQAARWEDGVQVEVSSIKASSASSGQTGAEGTGGEMVVVDLLVTAGSAEVRLDPFVVHGYYGADGVGAPMVTDPAGQLGDRFAGTLRPGESGRAGFGFAIPRDQLAVVTVTVDRADGRTEPVMFTGPIVPN